MKNQQELKQLSLHPIWGEVISEVGRSHIRSISRLLPHETQSLIRTKTRKKRLTTNTLPLSHVICLPTSSNQ